MPFDPTEAKEMIAFIAALEDPSVHFPAPPIPEGWAVLFTSPVMGSLDSRWQLWGSSAAHRYAIVIRGTVNTTRSIIADLMAVLIPAQGTLPTVFGNLPFKLAAEPGAAVHLGFALSMATLMFDGVNGILAKLNELVPTGAEVFITGHSQGAAVATLCRSCLHYSDFITEMRYRFKSYLFAQLKPGNDLYAKDFERVIGSEEGFAITNSEDWVPQIPFRLDSLGRTHLPGTLDVVLRDAVFFRLASTLVAVVRKLRGLRWLRLISPLKALEFAVLLPAVQATVRPLPPQDPEILGTTGFSHCGTAIRLNGIVGALNPSDPRDYLWHHHAEMYYQLLCQEYPDPPADLGRAC